MHLNLVLTNGACRSIHSCFKLLGVSNYSFAALKLCTKDNADVLKSCNL